MSETDDERDGRSSSGDRQRVRERSEGPAKDGNAPFDLPARAGRVLEAEAGIRIHRDRQADEAAGMARARAFAKGRDVFFKQGAYEPASEEGRRLIAHETAHVIQQSRQGSAPASREALEREADRAAEQAAQGKAAPIRERAAPGSLLLKEEKRGSPSVREHPEEITPAHPAGTMSGPGFSVRYQYTVVRGAASATLALTVPQGIGATVSPASGISSGQIRIQGSEGLHARTVSIILSGAGKDTPRIQVNFSKGSSTYSAVFQFPPSSEKK